jgi:hypothetical protein
LESALSLIRQSLLLKCSLVTWSTSVFHAYEIAVLMQRVESVTDVLFLDFSVICELSICVLNSKNIIA